MPGTSLYDVIVPTFTKGLKTFDHVLAKAEEYAKEKGLNADEEFPEARLIDDQRPLTFQVQVISKTVQTAIGRLTGEEVKSTEDDEKTVGDLRKRIAKTLELVESVKPDAVNSREDTQIDLVTGGRTLQVTVKEAIFVHSQTNFFFHLVTAYSILRAKGVPLGKGDYLANFINA